MTGIAADPLAWSAILAAGAAGGWLLEHHWQRFTAGLFALSAFMLVLGWGELNSALAALLLTGKGTLALVIVTMVSGAGFYLGMRRPEKSWLRKKLLTRKPKGRDGGKAVRPGKELVPYVKADSPERKNYHHRVWTHLAAIVLGASSVVVVGGAKLIAAAGSKSLLNTGRQFIQSSRRINSGKAAAQVPASHRPGVYFMVIAAVLVTAFLMYRHESPVRKARKAAKRAEKIENVPAQRSGHSRRAVESGG